MNFKKQAEIPELSVEKNVCRQKMSADAVQPFGRPEGTYIYMFTNVLLYYIDKLFSWHPQYSLVVQ